MSKVLTVMGLNWLYWRDLGAGIMVPRRHLAVKPGTNWRYKQLQSKEDYFCIISGQKCAVPNEFDQVILCVVLIDTVSYP